MITPMTAAELDCLTKTEQEFRAMYDDMITVLGTDEPVCKDVRNTAEYVMHLRNRGVWIRS
jgi:hypothetical protein